MSNAQKLKKSKKKGMSPEAKATLGNAFKGIISNQSCVDGGKEGPWWVAVIFLLISIILPLIPIMVNLSKVSGSQSLAGINYGLDRGINNTFVEAKADGHIFQINGGSLSFNKPVDTDPDNPTPIYDDQVKVDESMTYNFMLYTTNLSGSLLQTYVDKITKVKYEVGTLNKLVGDPDPDTKYYTPSFLVLAPNTMAFAAYKYGTTEIATTSYGGLTWNHSNTDNLITTILGDDSTPETTIANFRVLLDQTYLDQKNINFRNNTLIYLGVYAGLIFFLGVMVFVLTRGKKNMYHFLSFYKCQKITWWASFTPALLGMIFAFIFSTNMIGQMSFVVFLALRIMWMSMRQLRPVQ